jgi:regulator of protease activity HflC (stomatin/prohibitin superfamily)
MGFLGKEAQSSTCKGDNSMKLFRYALLAILAIALPALTGCSYKTVSAGNVGVKFNLYGSDKGVQSTEVGPGRYWLSMNEYLYEYPTTTQMYNFTQNPNEGSANDESFHFQTIEGLSVNADVSLTYHLDPDKIPVLFQKYRKGTDEITTVYLHNYIRDAFQNEASKMGVESVYGSGKTDLINNVQKDVATEVAPIGIVIDKISFTSDLRLPDNVQKSINAKIQATQMAEQRKNEVAQAQAEGAKEVALAQAHATARIAEATAEAQAITLQGDALAKNPGVVQLRAIEKWDGRLPTYNGGGTVPFVNLSK